MLSGFRTVLDGDGQIGRNTALCQCIIIMIILCDILECLINSVLLEFDDSSNSSRTEIVDSLLQEMSIKQNGFISVERHAAADKKA